MANVLVVEDSPTQAKQLASDLDAAGHRASIARDGIDVLGALGRERCDVMLTDVVMPGLDGYELCRAIKGDERLAELPMVVVTSLTDPTEIVRASEPGADTFVRKPYDAANLLSSVDLFLLGRSFPLGECRFGLTLASVRKERQGVAAPVGVRGVGA